MTQPIIAAGLDKAFAEGFVMLGGIVAGLGILVEGAALSGAKYLVDGKGTASKITKVALAVIALASAVLVTGSMSLAAVFAIGLCFPSSTVIPLVGGGILAMTTVYAHYKAFQWARLI